MSIRSQYLAKKLTEMIVLVCTKRGQEGEGGGGAQQPKHVKKSYSDIPQRPKIKKVPQLLKIIATALQLSENGHSTFA